MRTLVLVLIMSSCLAGACGEDSSDGQQGMDGMTAPNPVTTTLCRAACPFAELILTV